jgi:predicted nucleic acid-binding protein
MTPNVFRRARELVVLGLSAADAVHLSAAEMLGVDVLLTCDDRFLHRATRLSKSSEVPVVNPVDWLKEQIDATKS